LLGPPVTFAEIEDELRADIEAEQLRAIHDESHDTFADQ
jgi:hypothetical protein